MNGLELLYGIFKTTFSQVLKHMDKDRQIRDSAGYPAMGVEKKVYDYETDGDLFHTFNIYTPSSDNSVQEDLPLIIDIHGGCWASGDKDVNEAFCRQMASWGNQVISISYRLADDVLLKDQVKDIFTFMHYLKGHASRLRVSLDEIMLTGDSAGAQLSLLFLAVNESPKLQNLFEVCQASLKFTCLVLTHPVCWVDQAARVPNHPLITEQIARPGLQRMLYGRNFKKEEIWKRTVSPNGYITKGMNLPPILIVASKNDTMFGYQAEMLKDFFDEMDISSKLYMEKDSTAGHVFNIIIPLEEIGEKCNRYILKFYRKCIQKDKKELRSSKVQSSLQTI